MINIGPPPESVPAADIAAAYAACEAITRREARNFSYGIRLLPAPRRAALSAVYALARRIDDIGDEPGGLAAKTAALTELRAALRREPDPADPVLLAVADAARRYPVPMGAFDELIDGVEADVRMDDAAVGTGEPAAPYAAFDDMIGYCRQVAGSVGRLCLGIFGSRPDPGASELADRLGIALQQTNILRDIREDLLHGRIYLPADELAQFGVELRLGAQPDPGSPTNGPGALADPDGSLAEYIKFAADRAQSWYADGLRLLPLLDRRSAACTAAMAGIYRRLLAEIAADPPSVYARRRSLSGRQKLAVAARALLGGGW